MAKKQATVTETAAAAAAPARAPKPAVNTPRVRTVKHSKTVVAEPAVPEMEAVSLGTPERVDHHAAISRIAYSYWEARGYQGGSQEDDWLRAEQEYRQRSE